jgi:hypothetical protein
LHSIAAFVRTIKRVYALACFVHALRRRAAQFKPIEDRYDRSHKAEYHLHYLRTLTWIKASHAGSRNSELTVIGQCRYNFAVLQRG